ncbi:hypothetical protein [Streptomyces sp. NPDC048111]|uniref:hypothetical protein n=1 Tax=Streptomyces sp. NPDC048111 TaxID=3365500 RepID=UPI0037241D0C
MPPSHPNPHDIITRLAAGTPLEQALDPADPDAWVDLDVGVRELAWRRPELFHLRASPSGRQRSGPLMRTITWTGPPDDAELALALCHPDGHLREAALDRADGRPALLPLIVIRCADWAGPVRERARAVLAAAPPHRLAAHAPLVLRTAARSRGDFARDLLSEALRTGPAADVEALLGATDRATSRLAHRIAVERRLLPAVRLAQTAAHHADIAVQTLCAEAAVAALSDPAPAQTAPGDPALADATPKQTAPGDPALSDPAPEQTTPDEPEPADATPTPTAITTILLTARHPQIRAAGVTALRRAERYADAEPYLADRAGVVRACARYVLRQGGIDPIPLYRALCADPASWPAATVGLGECGKREDTDLLRTLLTHPRPAVRAGAVAGLRALDAAGLRDVQPLLEDPASPVVRQATAALLPWADRIPPELLHRLRAEDRPRHQQVAAARLLRAAGTKTYS